MFSDHKEKKEQEFEFSNKILKNNKNSLEGENNSLSDISKITTSFISLFSINNSEALVNLKLKCSKCGEYMFDKIRMPSDEYIHEKICNDRFIENINYNEIPSNMLINEEYVVPRQCKCKRNENEENDKYNNDIILKKQSTQIKENRNKAFDNEIFKKMTLDKDDGFAPKMTIFVKNYIENFEKYKDNNIGFIFMGDIGVGKTFYACCIANGLLEKGYSVLVSDINQIIYKLKNNYGKNYTEYLDYIKKLDLLVIDDFGVERNSDYMLSEIYYIINARYNSNKPMFITTNLSQKELQDESLKHNRIYDRIRAMCQVQPLSGASRRNQNDESVWTGKRKETLKEFTNKIDIDNRERFNKF